MTTKMENAERLLWRAACVLLVAVYVSTVPRIWQCEGVDEFEYLGLAHSLARGEGYTLYGEPHVLYPPAFATLLSVVMRVAGVTAWRWMYATNAVLGAIGWILIGSWLRRRFNRVGRWAAWFLISAYYPWSFPCRYLMSEPLFLPISFLALILAWRILERNRGVVWEYVALGTLCLLGQMTRSAAITLQVALVAAGGVRWMVTRRPAGLAVALLALLLGGGFFGWWSSRADRVAPHAAESHWRWAKKYLGLSRERDTIVARGEEITPRSARLSGRIPFWITRYGQFVTSVVRPPRNFLPLAALLSLLFVTGLAAHGRRYPWSPPAWYTVIFTAMILMTTWLSNYQRFLLVLAPFLFWFLLEGAAWWHRRLLIRPATIAIPAVAVAAWGLYLSLPPWLVPYDASAAAYARWIGMVCVAVYVLLAVGAVAVAVRRILAPTRISGWILALALGGMILHTGGIVMQRCLLTRANHTPEATGVVRLMHCGAWLRSNSSPSSLCVASVPRLVAFLADRTFERPRIDADGILDPKAAQYIVLMGALRDIPQYRRDLEESLAAATAALEGRGGARRVFSSGSAAVYEVVR